MQRQHQDKPPAHQPPHPGLTSIPKLLPHYTYQVSSGLSRPNEETGVKQLLHEELTPLPVLQTALLATSIQSTEVLVAEAAMEALSSSKDWASGFTPVYLFGFPTQNLGEREKASKSISCRSLVSH